jgi:tetratricopeptide (TPR) repeat protein
MATYLQSIGDYRILGKLGRGGMGDVYLAVAADGNRRLALKVVERGTSEAEEFVAAERLGAQLQSYLCGIDPRVTRIHSFGDIDGHFYIDMEYVEGKDLAQILREGPIPPGEAVRIAAELCNILSVAHTTPAEVEGKKLRGIIHGDIKPTNIRIDTESRVRVLDFGIAKGLALTRKLTSNPFASSPYSSPERLEDGRLDELSDLWSVGVVLYEMIEGRRPFDGPSDDAVAKMVRSGARPRPLGERCPRELAEVLGKALARSPERRYGAAQDFETDLRAYQERRPTVAALESEETRRSEPDDLDEAELTRRESPAAESAAPAAAPVAALPAPLSSRRRLLVKRALLAVPLLLAAAVIWEAVVYRSATAVAASIDNRELDADQAWERYEALEQRSLLGIAPLGVRGSITRLLVSDCDRFIDDYRNSDAPRAREADWLRCKKSLERAAALDSADNRIAAKRAYVEGHLLRIGRKDAEAVAAFERAAQSDSRWPDPYLGMARSYIYGLRDYDRGMYALEQAEKRGHHPGKRERAQLADAHGNRANQYWQGAVKVQGSPTEKDLLHRAKDDLEEALKLYSEIVPWGETPKQIRAAHDLLDKVKERLKEVDPAVFSWEWWKKV